MTSLTNYPDLFSGQCLHKLYQLADDSFRFFTGKVTEKINGSDGCNDTYKISYEDGDEEVLTAADIGDIAREWDKQAIQMKSRKAVPHQYVVFKYLIDTRIYLCI